MIKCQTVFVKCPKSVRYFLVKTILVLNIVIIKKLNGVHDNCILEWSIFTGETSRVSEFVEIKFIDVFKELIASFFIATLPLKVRTASSSEVVTIFTTVNWCRNQTIIRNKGSGLSDRGIIFCLC